MQLQTSCIAFLYWDASKTQPLFLKKKTYHECDTNWSTLPAHFLQSKTADSSPNFRWPEKHQASFNWKKMDRRKSQNEKKSKWLKNEKMALLCLSSRLFKFTRGIMRLHAFECVYLNNHHYKHPWHYKEKSIRTVLSEHLNLYLKLLGFFKRFKNQIRLFGFTRIYKVKNKYSKKYTWAHFEKTRKWLSANYLIRLIGVKAMFFHLSGITHVILKKNRHVIQCTARFGMGGKRAAGEWQIGARFLIR